MTYLVVPLYYISRSRVSINKRLGGVFVNINFLCEERRSPLKGTIPQRLTVYALVGHRVKGMDAYD